MTKQQIAILTGRLGLGGALCFKSWWVYCCGRGAGVPAIFMDTDSHTDGHVHAHVDLDAIADASVHTDASAPNAYGD